LEFTHRGYHTEAQDVTDRQKRIVREFERLVHRAYLAGLYVVVDSDAVAIRVMTRLQGAGGDVDLRALGEKISVDNACGGSGPKSSGEACKYGNT